MPLLNRGYVESSQQLITRGRDWSQIELLKAAERAQLRNTGWPLGVVLNRPPSAPVAVAEGVECRVHRDRAGGGPGWEDYWYFRKDGSYYVARLFEEEFSPPDFGTSQGHPERSLWFDTRVWRIAEAVLHSAVLCRELGLAPDEPYLLAVNHGGLRAREFWSSSGGWFVTRGKVSHEDQCSWSREVSQDRVEADFRSIVSEIARGLFALFDFTEIPEESMVGLVNNFSRSKI